LNNSANTSADPKSGWDALRQQAPVTQKLAYFDHAAVAPLSQPARLAMAKWANEATELGDTVWPAWAAGVENTRSIAAGMINAETAEIALVPNTTAGINLVAEGFPWREGDNVVAPENEFPSNLYPWMNLQRVGVECRRVAVPGGCLAVDDLLAACDGRTRLITCSWVGYASGWRMDVAELVERAHQRGILVALDAIQGMGVFPLDVKATGVDFVAADGHKWMLGPEGAGVFYTRLEHLNLLSARQVGWNSVAGRFDFNHIDFSLRESAARFEGGSQNMAGMLGLGASLQLLTGAGTGPQKSAVGDRVLEITHLACEQLERAGAKMISNRTPGHDSGIVTFVMPGRDPAAVRNRCMEAGVVLSCRNNALRIAPHAYTNQDDISRLYDVLKEAS